MQSDKKHGIHKIVKTCVTDLNLPVPAEKFYVAFMIGVILRNFYKLQAGPFLQVVNPFLDKVNSERC